MDGILSALHWLGMDADEGPYRQSLAQRPVPRGRRRPVGRRAPLRLRLHPRRGLGPQQGGRHPHPRLRRPLPPPRTGPGRGTGPALRHPRRGNGHRPRRDPGRRRVPLLGHGRLRGRQGQRRPPVRAGQRRRRHRHGHHPRDPGRGPVAHHAQEHPRCGARWPPSAGRRTARADPPGRPTPPLPVFAHLPMLVNEARKKLSKRKDPVAVESYREQGYLPDAFVNYLGLLGWSPPNDESEIFTRDQMVDWFALSDVNHSPAFFDVAKLTHMNGEYIRALPLDDFVEACRPWTRGRPGPVARRGLRRGGVPGDGAGRPGAGRRPGRGAGHGRLPLPRRSRDRSRLVGQGHGRRRGGAGHPGRGDGRLRSASVPTGRLPPSMPPPSRWPSRSVASWARPRRPSGSAVTGRRVGPPLFEALEVLGPDRTLARLAAAADRLAEGPSPPS